MNLQHPYPTVVGESGRICVGGDQRMSRDPALRRCGCGIVAAADLLRYLHRWHERAQLPPLRNLPADVPLPQAQYERLLANLRRRFPLFYPFGTNGMALAAGLNRLFQQNAVPYRASWGVPSAVFWETMAQMLEEDIPVILAVGANFPRIWERKTLNFYRISGQTPQVSNRVRAHFVVVMGLDEEWMQISTWGSVRYIRRAEYDRYRRQSSAGLLSNLLHIQRDDSPQRSNTE